MPKLSYPEIQDRLKTLFRVFLDRKAEYLDLKESKAIAALFPVTDNDAIAKAMASMDREELATLTRQVHAYEAWARQNNEFDWEVSCVRLVREYAFSHMTKRRRLAEAYAAMTDCNQFLQPGSKAEADKMRLYAVLREQRKAAEAAGLPKKPKRNKSGTRRRNRDGSLKNRSGQFESGGTLRPGIDRI